MKAMSWISTVLLACTPTSWARGEPNLQHEHQGDVFHESHGSAHCYAEGVLHDGNPTGQTRIIDGETLYIARPSHPSKTDTALLYLTDIFGNALVNNKLLADSFAKAGYLVVMPDLFRGDPVPADALSDPDSTFNITAWSGNHPLSEIESIIESAIATTRGELQASSLAGVGYCFGGKYIARFLAADRGLDAGFTAHPSNTLAEEWEAIANPISIAFGELDDSNTPRNRTTIEAIFQASNKTYQTSLYAAAEHGFAVRTNLTDPKKAFAQESAYYQAVAFLDYWVKGGK